MAPQATRIGLVFIAIISAFIGVRSVTVPESFGQHGHYRYAAVAELASRAEKYAGKRPCMECHADVNTPHTTAGVSCETCHGPGAAHVADFDSAKLEVNTTRAACGTCHAVNAARRISFPQIDLSDHYPSQRCVSCHKIHPDDAAGAAPTAGGAPEAAPADASASKPTAKEPAKQPSPSKEPSSGESHEAGEGSHEQGEKE